MVGNVHEVPDTPNELGQFDPLRKGRIAQLRNDVRVFLRDARRGATRGAGRREARGDVELLMGDCGRAASAAMEWNGVASSAGIPPTSRPRERFSGRARLMVADERPEPT
jgi:hypothetical protein